MTRRFGQLLFITKPFFIFALAAFTASSVHASHVVAGCLMNYGQNVAEFHRQAARYVDRILKGAKPEDLPVEQPTKIDLVINSKTAAALGLAIPLELTVSADRVIE